MLWAPILKELESKTGHRMDISNCRAPPNFTEKLTPHSMPKGSTWFNTSEIDGKSEYCPGCISRRKSRYGKTALTLHLVWRSIRGVRPTPDHGYNAVYDLIKRYGKRDVGEAPISERGLIALKTAVKKVIEEHAH
jgi:hypothetical protein